MTNPSLIVNTKKVSDPSMKVGGKIGKPINLHTIDGQDLYTVRSVPGQGGLGMVVKLEG